jgi:Uncharacterized protein conserved in bacteria (DUF2219)
MIASLAGSIVAMSCLGCATPPTDSQIIVTQIGPVDGAQSFASSDTPRDIILEQPTAPSFGPPLRVGSDFSPTNLASPLVAARFEALDLATPMPVRGMKGDRWGAEVSFAASGESTGLGLDMSFTPRAQFERNRAGNNVARTGAEFRVGSNLVDRDLRGKKAAAPSWYFFVGADNEALVWNMADQKAMDGATLRDQATVGDLQAGLAWTTGLGAQMSIGLVERKLKFNDIAGDNDVKIREQFAAFSYTLKY